MKLFMPSFFCGQTKHLTLLGLLCGMLFFYNLGSYPLLDPDETFYAQTAKEMLQKNDMSTPFIFGHAQFEKPILFYWVLYLFFEQFGANEFAARLAPAIAGTTTVFVTYFLAKNLFPRSAMAWMSALILATSLECIVLSRAVLTDAFLCLFVTASLLFFCLALREPSRKILWFGVSLFLALGFLTKGPLGVAIPGMGIAAYLVASRQTELLKRMPWLVMILVFSMIALPWYVLMTYKYGVHFLEQTFLHENIRRFFIAEHKNWDRVFFYPANLLIGFLPWSLFVLPAIGLGFRKIARPQDSVHKSSLVFLLCVLTANFLFFSIAKSKLLSYLYPLFPAASILIAYFLYILGRCLKSYKIRATLAGFTVAVVAATVCVLTWAMPVAGELFSVKRASNFSVPQNISDKKLFLASKMFVRGTAFYTGSTNMAVLSGSPENLFYTKHDIPLLSTRGDIQQIKDKDFPVYAMLRLDDLAHLRIIAGDQFKIIILYEDAIKCLLRLEKVVNVS